MERKTANRNFYHKSLKQYGISPQGVHWNSLYTQQKRFEILTKIIGEDLAVSGIVDADCGMGDLLGFLTEKNIPFGSYIGIDCELAMIKIAMKRFSMGDFYLCDVLCDPLVKSDYYLCSGAMNLLNEKDFYCFIENAFGASKKGFVFNFLKNRSFNGIKLDQVLAFCSSLSGSIVTRNDYLDNDFTVLMLQ